MSFGRYYEDFEVGSTIRHWPGRTITEADDMLFSMITMNHHPLHIDANFAATTQHRQNLVVGTLVFSLVVGITVPDISGHAIANLEYTEVKHLGQVFHGDTLYVESHILDKRESRSKPDRGIVKVQTFAVNQRGDRVLSFKRAVLNVERRARRRIDARGKTAIRVGDSMDQMPGTQVGQHDVPCGNDRSWRPGHQRLAQTVR